MCSKAIERRNSLQRLDSADHIQGVLGFIETARFVDEVNSGIKHVQTNGPINRGFFGAGRGRRFGCDRRLGLRLCRCSPFPDALLPQLRFHIADISSGH